MATAHLTCPVTDRHTLCKPSYKLSCNPSARSLQRLPLPRCGPRLALAVMFCPLSMAAQADLPLAVESLLTDKGKLKLNLSLAYSNNTVARLFNSDVMVGAATLRYGLTGKTEIYARGSSQYSNSRATTGSATDARFLNTWAGASYQFKKKYRHAGADRVCGNGPIGEGPKEHKLVPILGGWNNHL